MLTLQESRQPKDSGPGKASVCSALTSLFGTSFCRQQFALAHAWEIGNVAEMNG